MSAKTVPDGEYADLPGVGSLLVHIDDDRRPADDEGVLADGVMPPEAERADESPALGGYPALVARELPNPDEPLVGEDAEVVFADGDDGDDGVLHAESREPESFEPESLDE